MTILKYKLLFILCLFIVLKSTAFGQVIFRELPDYKIRSTDNLFFDITATRSIIPLNGKWSVASIGEEENKVSVGVPSIFEGTGEFIFEKNFKLTKEEILNNVLEIVFFGLNYAADISVNDIIIYRHGGGEYPFTIDLPRDIVNADDKNILTVKLLYKLDSENTIPLKQRFLFPKNYGGITNDVFIHLKPSVSIVNSVIKCELNEKLTNAKVNIKISVNNSRFRVVRDTSNRSVNFTLKSSLLDQNGNIIKELPDYDFSVERNKEIYLEQIAELNSSEIWSPENPKTYLSRCEVWQDEKLIDVTHNSFAVFTFKVLQDSIVLNNKRFQFNGVTYIPSNTHYGKLTTYDMMETDIILIKEAGFNSVRFSKFVPHPYYLKLCVQYGLLAFVELPGSIIPSGVAQDQNFLTRCRGFVTHYIAAYEKYPAVVALGFGGTYLAELESHISIISNLATLVKEKSDLITYASFGKENLSLIDNLDLYGLELVNTSPSDLSTVIELPQNDIGKGRILITEATYPVNIGNTDGYVNEHSYEAQAKYFEDLIDYSIGNELAGFFLNTMIDFRGDYSSLLSGYNEENLYNIGIVGEDRSTNRLTYKVVHSKLNNLEKVTIPIGSKKDDAPMVFIVFGLILALFMGILVNSGKKFREDASRALLRPYNFFADVRDQRIISAFHSTFLGIIIATIMSLIICNMLFYFKENFLLERLLLSFGSPVIIKVVNYLAWHPFISLIWLSLIGIILIIISSLIVKAASLFVRTRVYISSIYFTLIWSFLPIVLLIPIGIILYRVLAADIINNYIYIGLIVVSFWILYRLMKGIYVIFDASPGSVYFYCTITLIVFFGGILFYFEVENSAVQYLLFTLKQFNVLG